MGDLFSNYNPVAKEYQNQNAAVFMAYEKHYMELVRNYKNEISFINEMLVDIRKERTDFLTNVLPSIEKGLKNDSEISEEIREEWIVELRNNMEKSFQESERIIQHYITKNQDQFEKKMKEILNEG